ncbi:outer membrane beta-barrel protein [Rhodopseudomonas pseudopalustris]|uniref:outer membrane protein n=1 Tax=Rhodopseudomonas pseudopalustris TaxID=1513892 RepID=UPI000C9F7C16
MKKFLLGTVGVMALGLAPAMAADLPARAYTKAPPVIAVVYDWSGFYIGANAGWGSARDSWNAGGFDLGSHDATGAVAGGQIGYRWQAANWVFGLEAQGNWADLSGSNIDAVLPAWTNHSKLTAFGLFTGQVGYAWNNALLYVKGGAAVTSTKYDTYSFGAIGASSNDQTRWGGTVGVGFEYGFAPNWSVGVEYNHIFTSRFDADFYNNDGSGYQGTYRVGGDVDLVTARLNYRWGGPVVARY